MKLLPLRIRFLFLYSFILSGSIILFSFLIYFYLTTNILNDIDSSLYQIARATETLLSENRGRLILSESIGSTMSTGYLPHQVNSSSIIGVSPRDSILISHNSELFKHIDKYFQLNSSNYLIRIYDRSNVLIWENAVNKSFSPPTLAPKDSSKRMKSVIDDKYKYDYIPKMISRSTFTGDPGDSAFYRVVVCDEIDYRAFSLRTPDGVITVCYSMESYNVKINWILHYLYFGFPVIVIISILGGYFVAKLSLKPLNKIAIMAEEISESNLSKRIPVPPTNDEIESLAVTMNSMFDRLEDSFRRVRQFTSDASHELRTPLTIMRGEIEMVLRTGKTIEDYEEVLVSALEENYRLTKIVTSLLELSKADSGQLKIDVKNANLSKLICDISQDIEILAEEKNIRVLKDIQNNVYCNFDPDRMHQALLNIMDNSIKYNVEKGSVFISMRRENDKVVIQVRDTGVGIPKDHLPNIFNRLYRVESSRNRMIHGNGLGLSIVKWIIQAHRGTINVTSVAGEGTSFEIVIPGDN